MSDKDYLKRDVVQQKEQTWCRISDSGKLEHLDWFFVHQQAAAFDEAGEGGARDHVMTMCKLMLLVRQQTLEKTAQLVSRFADFDNNTSAVVMYDPVRAAMPSPSTFVFFHVGDDVSMPAQLVDSIQKTNPGAEIVMCTDSATPALEGVRRFECEVDRECLMLSRWEAYAGLNLEGPAVYLDTDMIVRGFINAPALLGEKSFVFLSRSFDRMIPFNGQQRGLDFSEHDQRPIGSVYPILGCFVITRSGADWEMLHGDYERLSDKYKRWYGDQEVLRDAVGKLKAQQFNLVEESMFACLPEHAHAHNPLIVHYKGNRKNAAN